MATGPREVVCLLDIALVVRLGMVAFTPQHEEKLSLDYLRTNHVLLEWTRSCREGGRTDYVATGSSGCRKHGTFPERGSAESSPSKHLQSS
jgi:hypothetical protein